jgi:microcystin-dependent protein
MTVTSTTARDDFVGNGATSVYSYNFRILANTDLLVTVADTSNVETTLTLTTDYTVSGVGDDSGGNVTLVSAGQAWLDTDGDLLTDYALTIRRVRPVTQTTDIRTQGPYRPDVVEDSLDHGIMVAQQRQDEVDRCLKLPETEAGSAAATVIPAAADRASMVLAFNASGEPIAQANVPTSGVTATAFAETLLDDTTAAAARDTLLVGPNEFSPASIGAHQNNYDVTEGGTLRTFGDVRLTASGAYNITGLTGGFEGARLRIVNIGASAITLMDQDAASLAANRMILIGGTDRALAQNDSIELVYFNTDSRWREASEPVTTDHIVDDAVTTAKILDDAVTTAKILNANVTLAKLAPDATAFQMPTGAMAIWTTDTAPTGYLLCYGQAVSRTTYADLFAVVSTTFGVGDGSTTFNVPDMRGRFPLGQDDMGGVSANRVTHANADTIGGAEGAETHTLVTGEMPAHNHNIYNDSSGGAFDSVTITASKDGGPSTTAIVSAGGGGAHENMSPYITMNYIIKT